MKFWVLLSDLWSAIFTPHCLSCDFNLAYQQVSHGNRCINSNSVWITLSIVTNPWQRHNTECQLIWEFFSKMVKDFPPVPRRFRYDQAGFQNRFHDRYYRQSGLVPEQARLAQIFYRFVIAGTKKTLFLSKACNVFGELFAKKMSWTTTFSNLWNLLTLGRKQVAKWEVENWSWKMEKLSFSEFEINPK